MLFFQKVSVPTLTLVLQAITLVLILVGLIATLFLVKNPQIFLSRAGSDPIVFKDLNGEVLPLNDSGTSYTASPKIKIEVKSPHPPQNVLGQAMDKAREKLKGNPRNQITPTPSPVGEPATVSPSPSPTSLSTPSPSPSPSPTHQPAKKTTVSFKLAEDPVAVDAASPIPYTKEPTAIDYEFKDNTPGTKFIFVKFIFSDGTVSNARIKQVELVPTQAIGSTEPYGVNDWNWTDDSMASAKEAGVIWMRAGINWSSVEAVKGTYVWSQGANNNIDFYFSQAQKYGMKISVVPYNAPDWAKIQTNDVWRDSGAYANFVRELLLRYPGKITAVEVLNEDSTISWPDTKWRDAYYYLPILKTAYQTVKAVDPGIIVTTAALWSSPVGYLEDLYQMGAKDYFDVVNFHYYPGKNSPANNFNWLISHYRQVMKKYGDGNKSIWLTEFGWNVDNAAQEANNIVSPQQQSDYMAYVLSSSMKSGFVGKVFWYDWHGDDGMTAIHTTNNYYWNTLQPQLVSSIGPGDTTLTVSNTTQNTRGETRTVDWTKGWPSPGTLIIDSEKINYTSLAASAGNTVVSGLTRGTAGSAAASHTAGVRVLNQDLTANFKRQAYYTYKNFIQANPQWDASKVTPLPDVPPPASSAIAITNNGFENSATDWSGGLTIDSSQGHSGNSSAKIVNTVSPTTRWVRASHKAVPVEPGKSYFLKAWVKIDLAGSGNMNAMVTGDLRNSAGNFLAGTPSNYYIYRTDGNWREIHYPFSTPADAAQMVIYVSTDGGTGTAWFDDISIEPYNLSN